MATKSEPQIPPWYRLEIGPRLKPPTRKLFETYSTLAPGDVESHLHAIRDRAWALQKYPCIGLWAFLSARTPAMSGYDEAVARLKVGSSIIDIGCCFGQDLRHMAADGAPTDKMYASDIVPELWDLSYDLYRDRDRMKARFVSADILDPGSRLIELRGKMDILVANFVFQLFDWERQVLAGKNMVALSRVGTLLIGRQIGNAIGVAIPLAMITGGDIGGAGGQTRFYHTPETWREMWWQIQKETGTKWEVKSSLHPLKEWGLEDEDYVWMGPHARGLEFVVHRVDVKG